MNDVRDVVLERMEDKDEEIADEIAIAAIKYGILKNNIGSNIIYEEEAWLALTGDTGPYLQYTNARATSVLRKVKEKDYTSSQINLDSINDDEMTLLRTLYIFPEVARESAVKYSPGKMCVYLNQLSRIYNTFYSNNRILDVDDSDLRNFRIKLTKATSVVLTKGLWLLGIRSPERM
jgi:arginyl-tRNA synthetase